MVAGGYEFLGVVVVEMGNLRAMACGLFGDVM